MTPVFLLAGKRFPLVSLPFRTLCEVLFEWAPSVSHMRSAYARLFISLALSPDWPTDRIDHLFIFSLALALSDFSINYSQFTSLSLALFYLFTLSFSRAEDLYRTTGDLRETRPYFAIVRLFCFASSFFFWVTLFLSSRISHTTGPDCPISGFSSTFVCSSFTCSTIALFRARPPLQLRSLCTRGAANVDLFSGSCFKTILRRRITIMQTRLSTLERDVSNPRWQAIPMRLFLFALGIIRGFSRRENWQRYFVVIFTIRLEKFSSLIS